MNFSEIDLNHSYENKKVLTNIEEVKLEINKILNQEPILYEDCISLKTVLDYIKDYRNDNNLITDNDIEKIEIIANNEKSNQVASNYKEYRREFFNNSVKVVNRKSINANFNITISLSGITIKSNEEKYYPSYKRFFNIYYDDYNNELYYRTFCDLFECDDGINYENDLILKNTYVTIEDCPKFMYEDITKIRNQQLKPRKKFIKTIFNKIKNNIKV